MGLWVALSFPCLLPGPHLLSSSGTHSPLLAVGWYSHQGLGQCCLGSGLLPTPFPPFAAEGSGLDGLPVCLCVGGGGYLESFSTSCKARVPQA